MLNVITSVACWSLWKLRNDLCFQKLGWQIMEILFAQSGCHGAELDYLMQDRVSTNFEGESGGDSRESFYGDVDSELIPACDLHWK